MATDHPTGALLAGVRIIESSLLGPGGVGMHLADLGADVIKVENPGGDYVRRMAFPIIDGISLLHWHLNRGKRSIVLDLKTAEGVATYLDLVRHADAVIEGMRPGALERRGLGYDCLREVNPKIVFCTHSGYGMTGPYKDMPSHGIAYDAWAGVARPSYDAEGFPTIPSYTPIGINAGPLYAALGICAAIIRARATGAGCRFEVAQSDAAAAFNWNGIEGNKAYERPEDEVTGNAADDYERRAPGTAGMREGVRYQVYETSDQRHVLFMASEQAFWKNFCDAVDRQDLFERWPGSTYADHARGNRELQTVLREIFRTRTADEWLEFGNEVNTPIAPVNTPANIGDDPQFQARMGWISRDELGADQLPSPIKVVGGELPHPTMAPTVGQHTDEVLRDVAGYDEARLKALREAGAIS